jgi:hypothetical protein
LADLPGGTAAGIAVLTQAPFTRSPGRTGHSGTGIVANADRIAELPGLTRCHHTGQHQTEAILAETVRAAGLLVFPAAWYALTIQANGVQSTVGTLVDLAVTVVVFAIADLGRRPDAAGAHPPVGTLTKEVPWPAFALDGRAGRHTGRVARGPRRGDAVVDAAVTVVILAVAQFGRGPDVVTFDVPIHARARALATFAHGAAAGHADPGQAVFDLVDFPIAVVVEAIANLGRGPQ